MLAVARKGENPTVPLLGEKEAYKEMKDLLKLREQDEADHHRNVVQTLGLVFREASMNSEEAKRNYEAVTKAVLKEVNKFKDLRTYDITKVARNEK